MTADEIYTTVEKMRDEVIAKLEIDPTYEYKHVTARARAEGEADGLQRVLHMLEDDFGVMRPLASLTAHLPGTGCFEDA